MGRAYVRRNYFVDKKIQTDFVVKFCLVMVIASLAIAGLSIVFLQDSTTVAIENTRVAVKTTADFIFPIMVQTLIVVVVASAISISILTLLTTHRILGPLYRIKKEVELLRGGDLGVTFRIRAKDELKDLAASLAGLAKSWKKDINSLKAKSSELKSALEGGNKKAATAKIEEIESCLESYQT
jgi:methyl-accepting chemotaxis protein